jgi:phi13 family phage major tail protein
MAITGLKGVRGATLSTGGKYENPFHIGDAIQANLSITMAEGSLYANNRRKEHKAKFDSGSIELGVDDLIDTVQAKLYGHTTETLTVGEGTGQKSLTVNVSKGKDRPISVGIGFYQTVTRDDVDMFRVIVLTKVQFAEPEDNAQTADNNITMSGRTTTGTILTRDDDIWKYDVTVETEAEAEAVLDHYLGEI